MRRAICGIRAGVVVLALIGFAATARAQQGGTTPQHPGMTPSGIPPMGNELPSSVKEKQERLRNEDRQKQLMADTEKLLQLATELHADVAKTDKNVLSVDVIKRAEEIERLAHAVKEKMRG